MGSDHTYPEERKLMDAERQFHRFDRRRAVTEAQKGVTKGAADPRRGESGEKDRSWTRLYRA